MRGRSITYSVEELEWLEERQEWPRRVLHEVFVMLFGRRELDFENLKALCSRKGWSTGRTGCFAKGAVPMNKGKLCPPGRGGRHPNAQRTQFKKGQQPLNTKWLGHERVNRDGYVEVSIAETNPHTGYERRYVHKHVHEWEKVNGSVPPGHCLKCMDGDKTNTNPSNWVLISRSILPRLNGGPHGQHLAFDAAAPEVRPAILALAKVDRAARDRRPARRGRRVG